MTRFRSGRSRPYVHSGLFLLFLVPVLQLAGTTQAKEFEVRKGYTVVDSITQFRRAIKTNDRKVRMKPGTYQVNKVSPEDDHSVFVCTGSNNHFDLRDVTIELPTRIYRDMRGRTHSLTGYLIQGDNNTFEGAKFENVGDHPPHQGLSDFRVVGDNNTFDSCEIITRGSFPYGYGSMFGIGGGSAVHLRKHSAMDVKGDGTRITNVRIRMNTFGHAIHMHGADNTLIRGTSIRGNLRPGADIYREDDGPAARFDFKMQHPPWRKGDPIPRDELIPLSEDGIRAYGGTGTVTVKNCTVDRMRRGIVLIWANEPAEVTGCTVTRCGHGYSLSSGSVVRSSAGDAAIGPLLFMPYGTRKKLDAELILLPSDRTIGNHPVAAVSGKEHEIEINIPNGSPDNDDRPILIGRSTGGQFTGRWTSETSSEQQLEKVHRASHIKLWNKTPHPVRLTKYASNCEILSRGPVEDSGRKNRVREE